MERIHLLAAEIFSYSYAHYDDHLGINERFDTLMPRDAEMLETALKVNNKRDEITPEKIATVKSSNTAMTITTTATEAAILSSRKASLRILPSLIMTSKPITISNAARPVIGINSV